MQRLYFVANDPDDARRVQDALEQCGVSAWNFHAIARDEAGLAVRRVHSATLYQQLDVIHSGERWALGGAALAGVVACVAWALDAMPWTMSLWQVVLVTLVGGLFGAWQGGMVGLSRDNYKIARFHDDIAAGRVVLLVDVHAAEKDAIRRLMAEDFPAIQAAGEDSTLINPLASARPVPQVTH